MAVAAQYSRKAGASALPVASKPRGILGCWTPDSAAGEPMPPPFIVASIDTAHLAPRSAPGFHPRRRRDLGSDWIRMLVEIATGLGLWLGEAISGFTMAACPEPEHRIPHHRQRTRASRAGCPAHPVPPVDAPPPTRPAGDGRGQGFSAAMPAPPDQGYTSITTARQTLGRYSFANIGHIGTSRTAPTANSSRVEFRLWDGSLEPGRIQEHVHRDAGLHRQESGLGVPCR